MKMVLIGMMLAAGFGLLFVGMSYNSCTGKYWWEK